MKIEQANKLINEHQNYLEDVMFTDYTDESIKVEFPTVHNDVESLKNKAKELGSELNKKISKNDILTMANMGQDIKEAMTGGSVAVVGKNTILSENIVNKQVTPMKTNFLDIYNGNMLDLCDSTLNSNGVNIAINDFKISVSGTTSVWTTIKIGELKLDNSKNYTLHVFKEEESVSGNVVITCVTPANTNLINWSIIGAGSGTKTTNKNTDYGAYQNVNIVIAPSANITSLKFKIVISENSTETNFYKPIYVLKDNIKCIDNKKENVDIVIPSKIYGVVGHEINIYINNIIRCDNIKNYQVKIETNPNVGALQEERFTYTPTYAGSHTITIEVYKNITELITRKAITMVISDISKGSGLTKSFLKIGDSIVGFSKYTDELARLFENDVMKLTTLGTKGTSIAKHEGRGGWTSSDYTTLATKNSETNPFYNNGFDFSYYMTQQGYSSVDIVTIMLGINNIAYNINNTVTINDLNTMINSIRKFSTSTKIGICLPLVPSSQDGAGKTHRTGLRVWEHKNKIMELNKLIIDTFDNRTSEGIYIVPIVINLDTANNFLTETVAINSRNSNTIKRVIDCIHPADSGYYQLSDIDYYWIKSLY